MDDFSLQLNKLNPPQREAVETLQGPLLVLAGAGTGKTRVLTMRLAHLLLSHTAEPYQILAVTFTNKAAEEMQHRVTQLMGGEIQGWWLGTFHALSAKMLRAHAELLGFSSNFTILDPDDQLRVIKQLALETPLPEKIPPAYILHLIERWKDRALRPDQVNLNNDAEHAERLAFDFYRRYQDRLKQLNACDFGDLLLHTITLFQTHPDVLAKYQDRFQYLLVDEYQDSNVAQYLWLRLLANKSQNLCCVGDDDQSIYGWRGAEVENILRFEKDFPAAKIVRLEQNYRSTSPILSTAAMLISKNKGRLGKTLWTDHPESHPVRIQALYNSAEEARFVLEKVRHHQREEVSLRDMAILVRTTFQMREFEELFLKSNLPYKVIGGARFYERLEIRDAIAYFRITCQKQDDLALERIINTPKRGIGDGALQDLYQIAKDQNTSLFHACEIAVEQKLMKPKLHEALKTLVQQFHSWQEKLGVMDPASLGYQIIEESGYLQFWRDHKDLSAESRVENLEELARSMSNFIDIPTFLEHVSLVMDNAQNHTDQMINIMTLHGAKGLEFDVVFLPGWENELFPSARSVKEHEEKGLEEERRLAYVGITRARKYLYISHVAVRYMHGRLLNQSPSPFLRDLEPAREPAPSPKISSYTPPTQKNYKIGQKVFHQKFGYGFVKDIDQDKLDIEFEHTGLKKIMAQFVEIA